MSLALLGGRLDVHDWRRCRPRPGAMLIVAFFIVSFGFYALKLNEAYVVLDKERKAAMVFHPLVVLCADREAQPVVNTDTLYG